MKVFHTVLVILSVLAAMTANAQTPTPAKPEFVVSSLREESMLRIELTESESAPNMCDLTTTRFEYFEDLALINIETKPSSFCPEDVAGARMAIVAWQIPYRLRKSGAVALRVNGKMYSKVKWTEQ